MYVDLTRSRPWPQVLALLLLFSPLVGCGWVEWPSPATRLPGGEAKPSETSETTIGQAKPIRRGAVESAPLPAPSFLDAPAVQEVRGLPAEVIARSGDTVYALSRRYHVSPHAIIEVNRLQPPHRLVVGQRVILPQQREHVVRPGETLHSVARSYDVDVTLLASANGLIAPYHIRENQRLTVPLPSPSPNVAPPPAKAPVAPVSVSKPEFSPIGMQDASLTPPSENPGDVLQATPNLSSTPMKKPPPQTGKGFMWPVKGKVISGFGPKKQGRQNDGINIAVRRGTPVRAAQSGVVAYVGNELRGFGNLVLIQHADGWVSAYAHNDQLLVSRGDVVHRGQIIAEAGSTGSVDTPQLHFQLRKGKRAVDPRKHLVSGKSY